MVHHIIHIKASPKQLSKLRNGHKVRIQPALEGTGFNLIIHPERYDTMTRTFGRGKGQEIQLTPEELVVNQEQEPNLEGSGIYSNVKSGFHKVASVLKPFKPLVKKGIDHIASYAPALGASTLSALALATGQPELLPMAGIVGHQMGTVVGNVGSHMAKDYLDQPSSRLSQTTSNVGGPRNRLAPSTLKGQVNQNEYLNNINKELGTNYGNLSRANISNAISHMDRANMNEQAVHHSGSSASRRFASGRGIIGNGGNFVSSQTHLPPALMSQPFSANFQFQNTLPPAYQKFSKGSGLY